MDGQQPQQAAQQTVSQAEQPLYSLPQQKSRLLIPKIITFILLSAIFYIGVIINISLLNLSQTITSYVQYAALAIVVLIIIFGLILNLKKANQNYNFYPTKLKFSHHEIPLTQIISVEKKQNLLDKLFKTYSLKLTKKFSISNISQATQIQDYLQKLINYAKTQQR